MAITSYRTIEGFRDSDNKRIIKLTTPLEEELKEGYEVLLTVFHDAGDKDAFVMSRQEVDVLIAALDDWRYGA